MQIIGEIVVIIIGGAACGMFGIVYIRSGLQLHRDVAERYRAQAGWYRIPRTPQDVLLAEQVHAVRTTPPLPDYVIVAAKVAVMHASKV